MTKKRKDQLFQRLNQLGEEWGRLQPEGDEGARLALTESIFQIIGEMFMNSPEEDGISEFFLRDWSKFDPEVGKLGPFVQCRVSERTQDVYRKDRLGRMAKDEESDEGKRKFVPFASLDAPTDGEDGGASALDKLAGKTDSNPFEKIAYDDTACQLLLLMAELPQRLEGRANNPTRQNYFRLFFTDGIATALHSGPAPEIFQKRENDLFHAIKIPFLDYFMINQCRTVDEIAASSTKPFGQTAEGKGPEETPLPLPNDVYITYLDRVEGYSAKAPAVTQQRQQYRQFIRNNLD